MSFFFLEPGGGVAVAFNRGAILRLKIGICGQYGLSRAVLDLLLNFNDSAVGVSLDLVPSFHTATTPAWGNSFIK